MSHQLEFRQAYKSITGLPSIVLPSFVVLTGVNGSGKTHLLEALQQGGVVSSVTPSHDIRLFNHSTIVPKDTGEFDPISIPQQRNNLFAQITNFKTQNNVLENIRNNASTVPEEHRGTLKQLVEFIKPNNSSHLIWNSIVGYARSIHQTLIQQNPHDRFWQTNLNRIWQEDPTFFLTAETQSEFFRHSALIYGEVDPFQQAFGRVFATYREFKHANDRLERYPDNTGQQHALSEDEFVRQYGPLPWEFVNRILQECELDFRVDSPPMHETTPYEPKLTKLSKAVEMRFGDLSSGEKVLMSFALCLYNAQETRQTNTFPKLLLLDEVDAPLHPSMTKSLLGTIQNVLVKEKNIAVIMTTHSPSTVALAPEEAIYAMNPDGPKVEKISKNHALSLLTTGVPTLSVSFDGRRQVFVESKTDAKLYGCLYQKYKEHLNSERSLEFIAVGHETNGGCAQVQLIVGELVKAGNQSVFGLIDWDGKNTLDTQTRIHVLSANLRDGLENALFDPVLIFAAVVNANLTEAKKHFPSIGIDSYESLTRWSQEEWQMAVDALQKFLEVDPASPKLSVQYLNEMTLQITEAYLHTDDHKLKKLLVEKFPYLERGNSHTGNLMQHIVGKVLADKPKLLPKDILDTFQSLLSSNPMSTDTNGETVAKPSRLPSTVRHDANQSG